MSDQSSPRNQPSRPAAPGPGLWNYVWVAVVLLSLGLLLAYRAWQGRGPVPVGPKAGTTSVDRQPVPVPDVPPPALSFSGGTENLPHSAIVPALNTLLPQGKNAVWCASFQVAWNRMKNDIIKAPISLENAQQAADCLNAAPQGEEDLPPESYYAAAGFINKGIAEQIRQAMAQKFPSAPPPRFISELVPHLDPIVAYAYISASVIFSTQLIDQPSGLVFRDSAGRQTPVAAFGFSRGDPYAEILAQKARVLWLGNSSGIKENPIDEYVVDVCYDSQPNQIVLALVPPKATLDETYKDVRQKIEGWTGHREADSLKVPNMYWKASHHFSELEHKHLLNAGFEDYGISNAQQDIEFRLDRRGAKLVSEARLEIWKSEAKAEEQYVPLNLIFDQPFLLYIKKRGAANPMFVMWVDNAELLAKR